MSRLKPLKELLLLHDSGVWVAEEDKESGVSILRSTNFTEEGLLSFSNLALKAVPAKDRVEKLLHPGDILVEKSGGGPKQPVGRVCLFCGDLRPHVFGNFVARLRVNDRICSSEYLCYFLLNFHRVGGTLSYQKQTTGIRNLEFKRYLGIEVPLPPLTEQRRIVDILNHAAGIRRLRRQALETTRRLIPALFLEMFGDPAGNPKGWEVKTVGSLLSSAEYGTSQKASEEQCGVPVLRMGNVTVTGELDLNSLKYVELSCADLNKYRLQPGDILFNRTNSKELVGKTGIWDGRYEAVAASYFIRLRIDFSQADPWFVWGFFNTRHMKHCLFETARGAIGQANINAKEVKAFRIPVPPLALQQAFASRVADLHSLITQQERSLAQAEALMHSLMARYFGETGTGDAAPCDTKAPSPLPLSPRERGAKEKPLPVGEGEHDLPLVAEPSASYAADTVPRRIISHMLPGRDYSRAEIVAALGLSDTEWAWAIRQLKEEGAVVRTGERRGARYSLKGAGY